MMSRRRFLFSMALVPTVALSPPLATAGGAPGSQRHSAGGRHQSFLSDAHSLLHTTILKNDVLFVVADRDGGIRPDAEGRGLFYHDCRFLRRYELTINGQPLQPLISTARGFEGVVYLTNPTLPQGDASQDSSLKDQTLHVTLARFLDAETLALHDTVTITNYGKKAADLRVAFTLEAGFEDIYALKGVAPKELGTRLPVERLGDGLIWIYNGQDEIRRRVAVHFEPRPHVIEHERAEIRVTIPPHRHAVTAVTVRLSEIPRGAVVKAEVGQDDRAEERRRRLEDERRVWLAGLPHVVSDNASVNELLANCFLDWHTLQCRLNGRRFLAAGAPWFVGLFGRDSLVAALQCLPYDRGLAADTLRLLALYQGQRNEERKDEQPGKILHELRLGEAAHLQLAGQAPYYGTVDATLWFLILLAEHARWEGTLSLFHELRPHVTRAVEWMEQADVHGTRFVSYSSRKDEPLDNHGWKDSSKAIVNADGSQAEQPIALVAAQGFAYMARRGVAELYWRAGDEQQAAALIAEAQQLRTRFNQQFWLPDRRFYALALQKGQVPAAAISSNPGQALWTGIVPHEHAQDVVKRLMDGAMFSGWGVRTLSADEPAYDPISYELGSVWPFDNAFIARAFRKYGFDREAVAICDGLLQAADHLPTRRLPELFCGFSRTEMPYPVPHPKADHPQAWSSGAIPYLLISLLGVVPDAFARRLRLVRPVLPTGVNRMEVRDLSVGDGRVSFAVTRRDAEHVDVEILSREGDIDVALDEDTNPDS